MSFDISSVVRQVGEGFTMSGVSRTYNDRGDATESYTGYVVSGVVQVTDGTDDEVKEGLLDKGDIIVFVNETDSSTANIINDNYVTISTSVSGIYRIVNVIHNPGHYEFYGKRILKT